MTNTLLKIFTYLTYSLYIPVIVMLFNLLHHKHNAPTVNHILNFILNLIMNSPQRKLSNTMALKP